MQSEEVKARFGRCPYCRAMIYQDPNAVIFYCSKCRTPIRGKNPRPTDEAEYALSQLEILSADTASVFSDDVETPKQQLSRRRSFVVLAVPAVGIGQNRPRKHPGRARNEESTGSPLRSRVAELRPSSRRTRRSMSGDVDVQSGTDSESDAPASAAAASYRRRASPLSSQELDPAVAMDMSGLDPNYVTRSALSDPAFQQDLLRALDNLRKLIAAVDQPRGADAAAHWHAASAARTSAVQRRRRGRRRAHDDAAQLPPHAAARVAARAGAARRARATGRERLVVVLLLLVGVEQPARWDQGALPAAAGRHAVRGLRQVLRDTAAAGRPARREQGRQAAVRGLWRSARADAAGERQRERERRDGPAEEDLLRAAACRPRSRRRRGLPSFFEEEQPEQRAAAAGWAAPPRAGLQLRQLAAIAGDASSTEPWSARVRSLTRLGRHRESLALLRHGDPSPPPHALALPAAVISCAALSLPAGLAQIHALAAKSGLLPSADAYLLSALLSSYSRLGRLPLAHQLLEEMPLAFTPQTTLRTAFNSVISGCALHALPTACFALFRRMRAASVPFDAVTLLALVPAAPLSVVPQVHALAARAGLAAETAVANCLISAYARCGAAGAALARRIFDEIPPASRDLVSWNAVLSAHAQNGLAVDALELYRRMCGPDGGGVEPDAVTLVGVLSSCAHLGARGVGLDVERYVRERLPGFRSNVQLIYELIIRLEQLVKEKSGVRESGERTEKEAAPPLVGFHSEKLAVAFGLLNTAAGSEIVVIKNLRVCGDCHLFLKSVSAIANRAFLVRDASRFHRFEGGLCSCKDYW
ncbi:hypothetical protein EJB05_18558 [Eragrostis curvula]|uniref:DYW domain-containing protein n=1 Tax=Eragrostis curvula TaxID=38414 RepID=A0A5J9VLG7_9POAL|nr:hypothetical protein EJB05_18558 [Eragrostis curvula]